MTNLPRTRKLTDKKCEKETRIEAWLEQKKIIQFRLPSSKTQLGVSDGKEAKIFLFRINECHRLVTGF